MDRFDDWNEYKKLVLADLKRNQDTLTLIEERLNKIDQDLVRLVTQHKFFASLWGGLGGIIVAAFGEVMVKMLFKS